MKWSILKISISDDTTTDFDVSEDAMPEFGLRGEKFPSKGGLSDFKFQDDEYGLRGGGGIIDSLNRLKRCQGTLIVSYIDEFEEFQRKRLKRAKYIDINRRILANKEVVAFEVTGNCYWMLYGNINFRGENITLLPGMTKVPNFRVSSIRKEK